jgi:glycosyltransferase involved in cell wall biosynthesis
VRVILVEPFHGGSHRTWAEGYAAHSVHEVVLVTHPGESWRRRLRHGALTLAADLEAAVDEVGRPDVLLVSDMVDLAALLGFARGTVGEVPVAAYFHENQLLYPVQGRGRADPALALVNWRSLAAADLVLFNSRFHRDGLMAALPGFLTRHTDERHVAHVEAVAARSEVLPVGVDLSRLSPERRSASGGGPAGNGPPLVVWNHRWEWDKQPAEALRLLAGQMERGVDLRVALAGESPGHLPRELEEAVAALGDRVVHRGFLPRDEYLDLLLAADIVLSTAVQEFFGVAVVEAVAAGCVPVLPDDLAYPEVVPQPWHAVALHDRHGSGPADHLHRALSDLPAARARVVGLDRAMRRFDWSIVAPAYDERLARLASTGG